MFVLACFFFINSALLSLSVCLEVLLFFFEQDGWTSEEETAKRSGVGRTPPSTRRPPKNGTITIMNITVARGRFRL